MDYDRNSIIMEGEDEQPLDLSTDLRNSNASNTCNLPPQYLNHPMNSEAPRGGLLRAHPIIPPMHYQDLLSYQGEIDTTCADVEFLCKDDQVVKGHRSILALSSTFFTTLFHGQNPNRKSIISVPEASARAIRNILDLCYKQQISIDSEDQLLETIYWLKQFGLNQSSITGVDERFWTPDSSQHDQVPLPAWVAPRVLLEYFVQNIAARNSMLNIKRSAEGRQSEEAVVSKQAKMIPETLESEQQQSPHQPLSNSKFTYWFGGGGNADLKPALGSHQLLQRNPETEEYWRGDSASSPIPSYTCDKEHMEQLSWRFKLQQAYKRSLLAKHQYNCTAPAATSDKFLRNSSSNAAITKNTTTASSIVNIKPTRKLTIRKLARNVPLECLKNMEQVSQVELSRIRWTYECLGCHACFDSSIKAHVHWTESSRCNSQVPYGNAFIKYSQGYYGSCRCPLCPKTYTTLYGFVIHCTHKHSEYTKLLSHCKNEDKLKCTNCGDKFQDPHEFHSHLDPAQLTCLKPFCHQLKYTPRKPAESASKSPEAIPLAAFYPVCQLDEKHLETESDSDISATSPASSSESTELEETSE